MDVVRHVRRAAGGAKTGHAGTLDPLASGVVICCLGKATRCVSQVMAMTKIYHAVIDLSSFTSTDDREGQRSPVEVAITPTKQAVQAALGTFVGHISQVPPTYSAVHVKGQRAYKMARRGESVLLLPRTVRVDAIEMLNYDWPMLSVRITCGRGTYIRSIARDLGGKHCTGGHLAVLCRIAVGSYDLSIAVNQQRLDDPITQADLIDPPVAEGLAADS